MKNICIIFANLICLNWCSAVLLHEFHANRLRNEFSCDDGSIVSSDLACNGVHDCDDGSDENSRLCSRYRSRKFYGDNGLHTSLDYVCDGDNDCHDNSDESAALCEGFHVAKLYCDNGREINFKGICNQATACRTDKSDESPALCKGFTKTGFNCDNGRKITLGYFCDGIDDCQDNSDENPALCRMFRAGRFNCTNGQDIPFRYICDGINDCPDKGDENPVLCNGPARIGRGSSTTPASTTLASTTPTTTIWASTTPATVITNSTSYIGISGPILSYSSTTTETPNTSVPEINKTVAVNLTLTSSSITTQTTSTLAPTVNVTVAQASTLNLHHDEESQFPEDLFVGNLMRNYRLTYTNVHVYGLTQFNKPKISVNVQNKTAKVITTASRIQITGDCALFSIIPEAFGPFEVEMDGVTYTELDNFIKYGDDEIDIPRSEAYITYKKLRSNFRNLGFFTQLFRGSTGTDLVKSELLPLLTSRVSYVLRPLLLEKLRENFISE